MTKLLSNSRMSGVASSAVPADKQGSQARSANVESPAISSVDGPKSVPEDCLWVEPMLAVFRTALARSLSGALRGSGEVLVSLARDEKYLRSSVESLMKMAKSADIPTDLHAVTTHAHAHFSLAIDLNGCDARFVRPEEEDLPTKMSVICEQTQVNQLSAQPSYVDQNAKVAPLQRPDVSKMTVPKGDAPFPSALAEFSAPNIIFGDNCRQAEFIASTISSRARDGAVQFIPQTMCIANHPAPGILEYYFEVKLLKLPRPNGLGVGFRSNLGDWVLGSDGRKWSVSRRAFSEDALVPGTYLDVLDQSQLCPSWEPVRVM
eukprot:878949_1